MTVVDVMVDVTDVVVASSRVAHCKSFSFDIFPHGYASKLGYHVAHNQCDAETCTQNSFSTVPGCSKATTQKGTRGATEQLGVGSPCVQTGGFPAAVTWALGPQPLAVAGPLAGAESPCPGNVTSFRGDPPEWRCSFGFPSKNHQTGVPSKK